MECIVAIRNNNPRDPRPHGQIVALYALNHREVFGIESIESVLEHMERATGHIYQYLLCDLEKEKIIYEAGCMFHPSFYERKEVRND